MIQATEVSGSISRTCPVGVGVVLALAATVLGAREAHAEYPSISEPSDTEAVGEKDAAVVVGVENYAFLPDVDGAMQSVDDWEKFFVDGVEIPGERVFTATNRRATREGSAAASEIVAAALRANRGATVVGTETAGRSSVQVMYELPDGSALKLSVAEYLRPNGEPLRDGLNPDVRRSSIDLSAATFRELAD